jgi:hypothetical protein
VQDCRAKTEASDAEDHCVEEHREFRDWVVRSYCTVLTTTYDLGLRLI